MEKYIKVSIILAIIAIVFGYILTPYLTNPILDNFYGEYNLNQTLPTNSLFIINGTIEPVNLSELNNKFIFTLFLKNNISTITRDPKNYGKFGKNIVNISGTCAKTGVNIRALAQPYLYYDGTEIKIIKVLEGC